MKVVAINAVNYGSTGNIMINIQKEAQKQGFEYEVCYYASRQNFKKEVENSIVIGTKLTRILGQRLSRYTGLSGSFHCFSTLVFLKKLKKLSPDIIHLHNVHGNFINLGMLFKFLKKRNIKVVWTLHDCWAFTGRCPYFTLSGCEKWKTGCFACDYPKKEYPTAYLNTTKMLWKKKRKWFTGMDNVTLVTPSRWLADLTRESFLKEYPVSVINNGINLEVFKPTESDFKKRYGLENKTVLLGVALYWSGRKGLDVFVKLSERLSEEYKIVLVGTTVEIDKTLPKDIITIHRTANQTELAQIYTAADLFVNPTREENFPTVNIEALACGTPVLTFETGGSPEIPDETCGSVVPWGDIDAMEKEIIRICSDKPFSKQACLDRAKKFDMNGKFDEYVKLYKEICGEVEYE